MHAFAINLCSSSSPSVSFVSHIHALDRFLPLWDEVSLARAYLRVRV